MNINDRVYVITYAGYGCDNGGSRIYLGKKVTSKTMLASRRFAKEYKQRWKRNYIPEYITAKALKTATRFASKSEAVFVRQSLLDSERDMQGKSWIEYSEILALECKEGSWYRV